MSQITLSLSGGNELLAKFRQLDDAVKKDIGQAVLRAWRNHMVSAAKAAVPPTKTPGHNNRSIVRGIRGKVTEEDGQLVAKVYVTGNPAFYFSYGTTDRYTGQKARSVRGRLQVRKTGNPRMYRGRMPANDFFQRAVEAAGPGAINAMQQAFDAEMAAYK